MDPAHGKVPALTEEARQRNAARAAERAAGASTTIPSSVRWASAASCRSARMPGHPMLPNYFYNNNYQIVQTKDHIMILVEMVHDVRIIRLGGEPLPATIFVPGWAIRSDDGKATRWSSRQRTSTRCRGFAGRQTT